MSARVLSEYCQLHQVDDVPVNKSKKCLMRRLSFVIGMDLMLFGKPNIVIAKF